MKIHSKANYSIDIDGSVIAIMDHDSGGISVEDDAWNILGDLAEYGIDLSRRKVIYMDATMTWHGMRIENGAFAGLYEIGVHDIYAAFAAVEGV